MRINYEEVKLKATRYYKDENGKKRQQTKTFSQTINPFNKNHDGTIKTRDDIWKELVIKCKEFTGK